MKQWYVPLSELTPAQIEKLLEGIRYQGGEPIGITADEDCIGDFRPDPALPSESLDYWFSQEFKSSERITFEQAVEILSK